MITDYNRLRKIALKKRLFPLIKQTSAYILGGPAPSLNLNAKLYPENIKSIQSYEIDEKVFGFQSVAQLDKRIRISFGDIFYAPIDPNSFYELDFCSTIKDNIETIYKFKTCPQMITLSIRPYTQQYQKDMMFEALEQKVYEERKTDNGLLITTDKNEYLQNNYADGGPMMTFFKL